jgi:hypothetical protein
MAGHQQRFAQYVIHATVLHPHVVFSFVYACFLGIELCKQMRTPHMC